MTDPRITQILAALEEIARPGRGIEMGDSDDVKAEYWASVAERCRSRARAALTAARSLAAEGAAQAAQPVAFVDKDQPNGIAWCPGYPDKLPDISRLYAQAAAPVQPGWIDVTQQKPDDGQHIWGLSPAGSWEEHWIADEPLGQMTHWRPFDGAASPLSGDTATVDAKDAQRYRWLRDHARREGRGYRLAELLTDQVDVSPLKYRFYVDSRDTTAGTLDEVIDAIIAPLGGKDDRRDGR